MLYYSYFIYFQSSWKICLVYNCVFFQAVPSNFVYKVAEPLQGHQIGYTDNLGQFGHAQVSASDHFGSGQPVLFNLQQQWQQQQELQQLLQQQQQQLQKQQQQQQKQQQYHPAQHFE